MKQDYYVTLGVSKSTDFEKIKHAYRKFTKIYYPELFQPAESPYDVVKDRELRLEYEKKYLRKKISPHHKEPPYLVQNWDKGFSLLDDFFNGLVWGFYENTFDRGKELYLELVLTPEEAFQGGSFPIHVPVIESCPQCEKTGIVRDCYCPVCGGYGRINAERDFSLIVPPHVESGTEITVSLEGIGLKERFIDVLILIEEC